MKDGGEVLLQLVIMATFGIACALIGHSRGRNPVGWFFVGFFFTCLGLILVLVLPNAKLEAERHAKLQEENRRLRERVRKERLVADQRHSEVQARLEVHDEALGVDTSRTLEGGQPALLPDHLRPPPLPNNQDRVWHCVLVDGQDKGPLSAREIADLCERKQAGPDSLVWKPGMKDWSPMRDVPEMKKLFNADA